MKHLTPGHLIEELLDARGWEQRGLAVVMGIDPAALSKIVTGARPVTPELALILAEVFGIAPEQFLDLQRNYDLNVARLKMRPDCRRADRAYLFGDLPIAEMIKRGWINAKNIADVEGVESELIKFFDVKSVSEIEVLPHAAKKTQVVGPATPTQLAWIRRVKQMASEMLVPNRFSVVGVRRAIEQLKTLLLSPEELRKVPRILAEAGIRFVIVESLKSAKIDGVCLWLNDDSPVIGLSLRLDRIDNFWFVLLHELEHVIRGDGRKALILDVDVMNAGAEDAPISEAERQANDAAAAFLVDRAMLEAFVARKAPFFAERDVLAFAKMLRVHPGLVVGQIQWRMKRFDLLKKYLVAIRSFVSPGSMVDGWGDVAPVGI